MLRRVINPILFLPLTFCINSINVHSSETKNNINKVLEQKTNNSFINYENIQQIILNNPELKSLENLTASASFNLSSQIAKRYLP